MFYSLIKLLLELVGLFKKSVEEKISDAHQKIDKAVSDTDSTDRP